jgi:hypothetical protein
VAKSLPLGVEGEPAPTRMPLSVLLMLGHTHAGPRFVRVGMTWGTTRWSAVSCVAVAIAVQERRHHFANGRHGPKGLIRPRRLDGCRLRTSPAVRQYQQRALA